MYYPDLKSVRNVCLAMKENTGDKKYVGFVPKYESDLPRARKELAEYFYYVWGDKIAALEVEKSVTKENYHKVMGEAAMSMLRNNL